MIKRTKHRYVIVGTGGRSRLFGLSLLGEYKRTSELAAICDLNQTRMDYHNRIYGEQCGAEPVATYRADEFEKMIQERRPDTVIVATTDRTHHEYIIRAMEMGCDVIAEKPLTIDAEKCRAILEARERTGRRLRVAFNYRYSPTRTTVKKLISSGVIGEVKSVHFEWLLDTTHGADYFRRWHRDKSNSGGLMVHKATHHFDLVNWWLGTVPVTVFGFGSLAFYGKANGEKRGQYHPYLRSTGEQAAGNDPFALDLKDGADLEGLYLEAGKEDGYWRDLNVFGDGISIEDTMNVLVKYESGAQLSYSLTAYSPWEGYRVAFNGTQGRIELDEMERSYVNAGSGIGEAISESNRITVFPLWEKPYEVESPPAVGGHAGGDLLLLKDLFGTSRIKDPDERAASHRDGALSILTGIAANKSFATGQPVHIADLLKFD